MSRMQQAREALGYSVGQMADVLQKWSRLRHLDHASIEAGIRALERGEAIRDPALAGAVRLALGLDTSRANPGMSGAHMMPRRR